jgi:hypothetical protein
MGVVKPLRAGIASDRVTLGDHILDRAGDALPGVLELFAEGGAIPQRQGGVALALKGALGKAFVDFVFALISGATAAARNRRERSGLDLFRGRLHVVMDGRSREPSRSLTTEGAARSRRKCEPPCAPRLRFHSARENRGIAGSFFRRGLKLSRSGLLEEKK